MSKIKIDVNEALKQFVTDLTAAYPGGTEFTRTGLSEVGKKNHVGFTAFASATVGFGAQTRASRGKYVIPADWATNPPWQTKEVPVASLLPAPTPKKSSKLKYFAGLAAKATS